MERATRSAVRCRVPVSAGDARRVGREDDRPVHLRQLRQALRRELGVEQEASRADLEHLGTVADDDEGAHVRLEDAVEALAQGPSGRDPGERVDERCTRPGQHAADAISPG